MRIGTERLIRALIGAGMVIGHEVGRDMTASRASRGAGIGCGAVAPVRGPLAARAIHAFVVAVAVHQLLANEGSGCGEEKFPDHDVLSSDAKGGGHQRTAWGRVPVKRKSSLIPLLRSEEHTSAPQSLMPLSYAD